MENNRVLNLTTMVILGGTLFAVPFLLFAYDDRTTHPALTQEMITFFNRELPSYAISDSDKELIIKGSIDEDSGYRWMRHFYDPVNNRGFHYEDNSLYNHRELSLIGAGAKTQWESSKEWALDSSLQSDLEHNLTAGILSEYFGSDSDYSWERAIYEYAWRNKTRGLESLGHALHLIEDSGVPDHTRNDPHPSVFHLGSPYESWAKKFNRSTISVAVDDHPHVLENLGKYFDELATYSNNGFFSKDTINVSQYKNPVIEKIGQELLSDGNTYTFGYKMAVNKKYRLVQIKYRFGGEIKEFSLKDADNLILQDYWNLLSKQTVLHGAGVIKLFFSEVEKEKQTKALYNKNRSWMSKKVDNFKHGVFNIAGALYGITVTQKDLEGGEDFPSPPPPLPAPTTKDQKPLTVVALPLSITNKTGQIPKSAAVKTPGTAVSTSTPETSSPLAEQTKNLEIFSTVTKKEKQSDIVFLGESRTDSFQPRPSPARGESSSSGPAKNILPSADTTPPATPTITYPPENFVSTSTLIIFAGLGEPGSLLNSTANSTTVSTGGAWSLLFEGLLQGTNILKLWAKDSAGNISESISRTIVIDSQPPHLTFEIPACAGSLSPDGCYLLATSTLALTWTSEDAISFDITCIIDSAPCPNFSFEKVLATTTAYILPATKGKYTFRALATDYYGNRSEAITKVVEFVDRPLIINEVGWAGTSAAKSEDEWIELWNPNSFAVSLSSTTLKSLTDGKPTLALSGVVAPYGYYLIERTDDTVISDRTADLTSSFGGGTGSGLSNSGEQLALDLHGVVFDTTPTPSCGGWCGGSAFAYQSMERYNPYAPGDIASNWGSGGTFVTNGKNASNTPILGTPGRRNGINYLIDKTQTILTSNKTLTATGSPYIIPGDFTIPADKKLSLAAGTIIKLFKNASIDVGGKIEVQGTESQPVIFTSFVDDEYGGDLNGDGTSTVPAPGDWQGIKIKAAGSELDHTRIRYAGTKNDPGRWSALKVESALIVIKNSIIEFSGAYGAWLVGAGGEISNSIFRNIDINKNNDSTGLVVSGGTVAITGNSFTNNFVGLKLLASNSSPVSNNIFTNSTDYALVVIGAYPSFDSNSASGSGVNGINIQGTISQDYTLASNLPFVIQNTQLNVAPGKTLTVAPGTIVKMQGDGSGLKINGKLDAQGTESTKIVFTSLGDDNCGILGGCGDTNGTTTQPHAGDWFSIIFDTGSGSSTLKNAVIRYGGKKSSYDTSVAALKITNSAIEISDSIIENNYHLGLLLDNSSSTIRNTIIRNQTEPSDQNFGLALKSSSPLLTNITFENNKTAIIALDSISTLLGAVVQFINNITNTTPASLIQ